MHKKILSLFLALLAVILAGCQLAVPEGYDTDTMPDPLIGVYITEEYLELFDVEQWLQENADALAGGNTFFPDTGSERLYGTVTKNGISFPGTEGLILASHYASDPDTGSGYWVTLADSGVNHIHAAYNHADETQTVELSASIYLSRDAQERIFYFNPVYQTAAGDIYVCSGQGMSMSGGIGGEMAQKTQASTPDGPQGDGEGYSGSFDIRIKTVEIPRTVTLLHMDSEHRIIREDTYAPEAMPQEVTPASGAAYILVETELSDGLHRSVHQPESDPVETFVPMDGGLCDIISTRILWPEGI